jgi:hypothetical protein
VTLKDFEKMEKRRSELVNRVEKLKGCVAEACRIYEIEIRYEATGFYKDNSGNNCGSNAFSAIIEKDNEPTLHVLENMKAAYIRELQADIIELESKIRRIDVIKDEAEKALKSIKFGGTNQ